MVQKKRVAIRIRYDPTSTSDPKKIVKDKVYKWFLSGIGEECQFYVENHDMIDEAMNLISQSYEFTKTND